MQGYKTASYRYNLSFWSNSDECVNMSEIIIDTNLIEINKDVVMRET